MKVESCAASETGNRNSSQADSEDVGAQHAAPLPQRMAGAADVTSELVSHRHHQRPRQNGTREEQAAREAAHQAQPGVALFQTDRLIRVEQVGANRDTARRNEILRPEVEIGVRGQLVAPANAGRARRTPEWPTAAKPPSRPPPVVT